MHAPTSTSPLKAAKVCAFAATTDAARCRDFYVGKLGLRLMHEDGYGIVFDSGGTMVRIQKGPELTPVPRTVLGWNVTEIEHTVADLVAAGVTFERFTWFQQDENAITTFPDGARVAWFKDPDGNILSVAQVPYR
jgi:catechol 2,3-dioxygenase-like lactoylglutathione lyase family enzyme